MDDDDDFFYDDDDDSQNGSADSGDVSIENEYYNSKGNIDDDVDEALAGFNRVVEMAPPQPDTAEWGFKALKQIVKIHCKLGHKEEMIKAYEKQLTYISHVSRNKSEKCINSLLETVAGSITNTEDSGVLSEFFDKTLTAFKETKNERLWFKTCLRQGKLLFDNGLLVKLESLLNKPGGLKRSCMLPGTTDQPDPKKASQQMETYALEIQMLTAKKDSTKCREVYMSSLANTASITHPSIMGTIKECGGKMYMQDREFEKANSDFFEAFKSFDEAGSPARIRCLKYVVLSNMLMKAKINPFDSPEAKPYKDNADIVGMTNILAAYQNNDIQQFQRILLQHKSLLEDAFLATYLADLKRNIRTEMIIKMIIKMVKPYTRVRTQFISEKVQIPMDEVMELLVQLILDNTIDAKIDQVNNMLELEVAQSTKRFEGLDKWGTHVVGSLHQAVVNKV